MPRGAIWEIKQWQRRTRKARMGIVSLAMIWQFFFDGLNGYVMRYTVIVYNVHGHEMGHNAFVNSFSAMGERRCIIKTCVLYRHLFFKFLLLPRVVGHQDSLKTVESAGLEIQHTRHQFHQVKQICDEPISASAGACVVTRNQARITIK